jgi:hypothetical protein
MLVSYRDDDLQGFSNNEISKFEILDMVSAMRTFKNADDGNIKEWLQHGKLSFQHGSHGHCQSCHETKA